MPDNKKSTSGKQKAWHRLWLPRWLLKDGRRSASPSRFLRHRDWNVPGAKADSGTGGSLPQTPRSEVTPVSRSSLSRIQVSDHTSYAAPSQLSSHRRAVSADRRKTEDFYAVGTRSLTRVSTSQLSAPERPWDGGVGSGSNPWFANDSLRHAERFDAGTYTTESISGDEDDFKSIIERELDERWILNLSLRFRNGKDCEKFFVTYLETPHRWRRVTVTCDYGRAEPDSLEQDLKGRPFQSDKNARIYESIRESIEEIEFFDTVTNLRLETIDGQLHVNVTEDAHEIISYPAVSAVRHLEVLLIRESDLIFEGHFSGFAYQVKYKGRDYVKKEIPGPDDVDEFLYEINALHDLLFAENVIQLKAIVVDDMYQVVKGLLIDFAAQGDLAGLLQYSEGQIQWQRRERWARQVVQGLMEIHEAGFVQGDLTVSNVVVDANDDAKIIDINRRGCPIGWEPPEFQPKLERGQRISMYIGVKSDLYQLGMILWAIAMEIDQPERERPLSFPDDTQIPVYYQEVVRICLSDKPRDRLSAKELLTLFPENRVSLLREQEDYGTGSHFVLDSYPSPRQDGMAHPDQIPRSFPDHRANAFRVVSAPDSLVNRNLDPSFEYSRHSRDTQHWLSSGAPAIPSQNQPLREGNPPGTSLETGEAKTQVSVGANSSIISGPAPLGPGLDFEDREIELEAPEGGLSFPDASGDPGAQLHGELDAYVHYLPYVGSNPHCSIDPRYLNLDGANRLAQRAIRNAEPRFCQSESSKTTLSDGDVYELAKETLESEAGSLYASNQDLLTSALPINPARSSIVQLDTPPDSDSPAEGRRSSKLRRVTPMVDLNDLFTSHLPINPKLRDEEAGIGYQADVQLHFAQDPPAELRAVTSSTPCNDEPCDNTLPPDEPLSNFQTEYLFDSILPINPAMPRNTPDFSTLPHAIAPENRNSASSLRLFNPALYTPISNTDRPPLCESGLNDPDSLFLSKLPINPAMPTPPSSPKEEPLRYTHANDGYSDLLSTSILPINPAGCADYTYPEDATISVGTQAASENPLPTETERQSTNLYDSKPAFSDP